MAIYVGRREFISARAVAASRHVIACALVVAALAPSVSGAQAQSAVKIVVPVPPGGAGDIVARIVTEQVGRDRGRAVVIENRPGAGTVIGTEAVARAVPDGNTLLITAPYLIIAPHLRKVGFDPLTAFEPISSLVSSPGVIVVNSASPYRTLDEFVDAAHHSRSEHQGRVITAFSLRCAARKQTEFGDISRVEILTAVSP